MARIRQANGEDRHIRPGSEKRTRIQFSFRIDRDPDMDLRVAEMQLLIREEAALRGWSLHGTNGPFPLPDDIAERLRTAFDQFMDPCEAGEAPPGTATTSEQRGIAQLLAESLHGHDDGADHLLWRSKRFHIGGKPHDP